jgi:hypothetical protein
MNNENEPGKFYFTVQELIEALKSFPSDTPVIVSGYENGFENFYQPTMIKVKYEPENMYFEGEFQPGDADGEDFFAAVIVPRVIRDD